VSKAAYFFKQKTIFAHQNYQSMAQKLKPTSGQKRTFMMHVVVFLIATAVMFFIHHKQGEKEWAYPWHAWIIAAWGLSLIGHYCAVYFDFEDKATVEYKRQLNN
jgi:hypothetical protein